MSPANYRGAPILSLRMWASMEKDEQGRWKINPHSLSTTKREAREHPGRTIPVWINPIIPKQKQEAP